WRGSLAMRKRRGRGGAGPAICRWGGSRRGGWSGSRARSPRLWAGCRRWRCWKGGWFLRVFVRRRRGGVWGGGDVGLGGCGREGALDSAALEAAVEALLLRHASLRAGFWHEGLSRAVQVIVPTVRPCWRRLDLSLLDEASRAERLASVLAQDRAERFDLGSAP